MTKLEKKVAIGGAIVGLILFIVIGFLPSAYTGGFIGVKLAHFLFGSLLEGGIVPRILVVLLMVLSVILSGAIFILGCTVIGWIIGFIIERKKLKEKSSIT